MTAAEYEEAITAEFGHPAQRDAWIGPWLVRRTRLNSGGYRYQADHASSVGATAKTVTELALRMETWDVGTAAMGARA